MSAISRLETGETPAVVAGLAPGDTIVSVDGVSTVDFRDLQAHLRERPGEAVTLTVVTDGVERDVETVLASRPTEDGDEIGFLGVRPELRA